MMEDVGFFKDGGTAGMHFVKESQIAAPPALVFAFHESPGALERLTPPWEKITLEEGGGSIRPGSRVVLRTQVGPLSLRWMAEHTEYDPPHGFADRQVSGPFASWHHRHLFLDDGEGGTRLRDEVDYEPPLGPIGRIIGGRFLEEKLRKLFDFRHETTRRIVEAGDFPGCPGPAGRPVAGPAAPPARM
jgi:ligand-binding SRPBCC domain-containing protein